MTAFDDDFDRFFDDLDQFAEVALVHVPHGGSFTVTGSALIRLLDAAGCGKGHPVRIVWQGTRKTQNNHDEKQFDLLVADLETLAPDDLPEIEPQPVAS